MPKRKHRDIDSDPPPGWAKPRNDAKDQRPVSTLNTPGAIGGWAAKASARSGPSYAPGVGKSS